MQHIRHISAAPRRPSPTARALSRRSWTLAGLAVLAIALAGCSPDPDRTSASQSLLTGTRDDALALEQLAPAARLAHRFAAAYARSVYLRRPPRLPGTTAALARNLATAGARVPPARRGLRPRAAAVALEPRDAATLAATVEIGDGRSPPFSVGFLVKRRASGWRVVAISSPG
jgi:hypothetical protein